jgi:hypothetical protein
MSVCFPYLLIPLFYYLIFILFKRLFGKIPRDGSVESGEKHIFRYDLAVAAFVYTLATVIFFYPALSNFCTSLIGPPEDNMHHFWFEWWMNKAFTEPGAGLTFSPIIFYPEGANLLYNDFCWYNYLLTLGLRLFLQPVEIYNLLILHTFILGGIGAFLLIRYLTGDSYLSLIGGLIYAFNPYHYAHALHHPTYASIQFIPFFFLFFLKSMKEKSGRQILAAGFFLLLNAISCWYYLIYLICFMVMSYFFLLLLRKRFFLPGALKIIILIAAPTLLIISPWVIRMVLIGLQHPEVNLPGHDTYVSDLFALFIPDPFHWAANLPVIKEINMRFTGNPWEKTVYLGVVNILLVLAAYRISIRKTARYFCGFWIFLILSGGVLMHILGWRTPIVLPYTVIKYIPFFSNVRAPVRLIIMVYLFWAIIVSWSLGALLRSVPPGRKRSVLMGLAGLLIFIDFFPSGTPQTPVSPPPCYQAIKNGKEEFGILDLPGGWENNIRYMMYQTRHGISLVQGACSRKIGTSLIDKLNWSDLARQQAQLEQEKVRYIIIHKNLPPGWRPINFDMYYKHYPSVYEDADNVILKTY